MTTHRQNQLILKINSTTPEDMKQNNQAIQRSVNQQLSNNPWTFNEFEPATEHVISDYLQHDFPETWGDLEVAPKMVKEHRWSCITVDVTFSFFWRDDKPILDFWLSLSTEIGIQQFQLASQLMPSTTKDAGAADALPTHCHVTLSTGQIDQINGVGFSGEVEFTPKVNRSSSSAVTFDFAQNDYDNIMIRAWEHPPAPSLGLS